MAQQQPVANPQPVVVAVDPNAARPSDPALLEQIARDTTDHGALANAIAEERRESASDSQVRESEMAQTIRDLRANQVRLEERIAQLEGQRAQGGQSRGGQPQGGGVSGPDLNQVNPLSGPTPSAAGTSLDPGALPTVAPIVRTQPTDLGGYGSYDPSSGSYAPRAYTGSAGSYAPRPVDTYYNPTTGGYSTGTTNQPRSYTDRYTPMTDRYGQPLGVNPSFNGSNTMVPPSGYDAAAANEAAAAKKAELLQQYAQALEARNATARQLAATRANQLRADHERIIASVPPEHRPYVRARLNEAAAESGLVKVDPNTGAVQPITQPTAGVLFQGEGFQALFPSQPTAGTETTNGVTMKSYSYFKGDETFMVMVASGLQANLSGDQLLDAARVQAVTRSGGRLVSETAIRVNNLPARDLLIETSDRFVMIRMVANGATVTTAVHSHGKFRRPGSSPFLASLQLR